MRTKRAAVQLAVFRSWYIPGAFGCFVLGALLGLPGILKLMDGAYREYLIQDFVLGEISDANAVGTYFILECVLYAVQVVTAGAMAVCLAYVLMGKTLDSMNALATVAQGLEKGVKWMGIALGVLFAYKFIVYTIVVLQIPNGGILLFSVLAFELPLGLAVCGVLVLLRKFLSYLCDTGASIAYTLAFQSVGESQIPNAAATGFCVLGWLCLVVAMDQMLTLTIVEDLQPHYKLLVSPQPVQWATAGAFVLSAAGNFLVSLYLKKYKILCERALYQAQPAMEE